jgi:hypothetical protein
MKTLRLFLFTLFVVSFYPALADWGHFASKLSLSHPSASYEGRWVTRPVSELGYDFQQQYIGRFASTDYLNLDSANLWTWKNGSSDICGASLNYRIYRTCDIPGVFNNVVLGFNCNGTCEGIGGNAGDQLWKNNSIDINLLSGLTLPGTYVIEVYFDYFGSDAGACSYNKFDSNGGNNYRAYFEFENSDSFTDGNLTSPLWTGSTSNYTIIDNSTVGALTGSEQNQTKTIRLNSSNAGPAKETNYLATQIANWGGQQEWRFWVGRNSPLTSNNESIVWLYANQSDLTSATVSGYRLRLGENSGAGDKVYFQKVENGVITNLFSSTQAVANNLSDFGIMFLVTRNAANQWTVKSSMLPQNSLETALSATAYGVSDADINVTLFSAVMDPGTPIAINSNGYFGFMSTNGAATSELTGAEFDNFSFKALAADTYFTFATSSSSVNENHTGTVQVAVEIHNPSATLASEVDVVLLSGAANRLSPTYTTATLQWGAGDASVKYLTLDPNDNGICDDNATLTFQLQNALGGNNASVGVANTHVLSIIDDNMGQDNLLTQNFESTLPATWISTPAGRWNRSNTEAVGDTGYSLSHMTFGSNDSSSVAISLDTMPLHGVQTVWRFQVRYNQDGLANSNWLTFLSANSTDLRNLAAVNGYAIGFDQRLGGTNDDILCLYKVTNGARTVLINTGLDWLDNIGSANAVSFEITLSEAGEWSVRLDLDGGFDNLVSYGTPTTDLTFPLLNAFGARVNFSSSSSNKFKLDDVSIVQRGCRDIWYSQASGNHTDAIWWAQTSGGTANVNAGRFDRFVIQSGHNVTTNGLWVMDDMAINSGATLTATANSDLRLFGDWLNDGTFVRSTSNVTFKGNENQMIFGSSLTRFYNLTIDNDGSAVNVLVSDSLYVHRVLRMNEGTLNTFGKVVLFSNSTWSASIGEIKPGANVNGAVRLQRYIPSIPYQYGNWMNLGNPLTGLTLAAWNNGNGSGITTTGYAGSDFPPPYSFINVRHYNEAAPGTVNDGYVNASNASNELLSDRGYFVWLNGSAQTLSVKGNIQQGNFNRTLSYTNNGSSTSDGWNLMTNPYPSEIDWNQVSSSLTGPRTVYVFDYQTNSYKTWTPTGANTGIGNGSRYIPHSQSFLVKVNTAGQYLRFQENYKTDTGAAFERSMGEDENASYIVYQLERNGMSDENFLFFHDDATAQYDAMDALHLASPNENSIQLSSLSSDNLALIQDMRAYDESMVVSIHAKMPTAGTYNFSIPTVGNLPAGACLYVEDIITGQTMQVVSGASMAVSVNEPFEGIRFRISGSAPAKVITTDATCYGLANGTIDVTVPSATWSVKLSDSNNNFEYVSNGSVTLDGLRAGTYQLEVINPDATCTSEIKTFTIAEPTAINAAITAMEQVTCNEGLTGTISGAVENTDWFSFEIFNESNEAIYSAEVEGNGFYAENLAAGLYTVKVYTECSSQALTADLRDASAPMISVSAPEAVVITEEESSVWLDATALNATSIVWTLSNGQTAEGEMIEVALAEEGVIAYTATAKGVNCDMTVSGSFQVKSKLLSINESSAISLLQQPEQLTITFGSDILGKSTVRLMDAAGRIVLAQDVNSSEGQTLVMTTSNLSNGVYTLQVTNGSDVIFTQKVFRK